MLKRQRPASPPPTPTIPLVDDPPFELTAHHQSKRRRILPPVLDGQVRGWGEISHEDRDDEEDEEFGQEPLDFTDLEGDLTDASGYKSANGVLHELHTLHRRRHFSSPSLPNPRPSWPQPTRPAPQVHDKIATIAQPGPLGLSVELESPENVTPTYELLRVTERYEETNRLLGSLFLSRRRQLGSTANHARDS